MDYQIREVVTWVKADVRRGTFSVTRNENHMVRLRAANVNESSMRVFAHNGILYIKCLSATPVDIELNIPETVRRLDLSSEKSSISISEVELDFVNTKAGGNLTLTNVYINKNCTLSADNANIILKSCDISSMNIQLFGGALEFSHTLLHGNNTAYLVNSTAGGILQGALVDYVISAGSGISAKNIVVNDHLLSEFPNRKNVQNCAWLLLAGSLKDTANFRIIKPRTGMY